MDCATSWSRSNAPGAMWPGCEQAGAPVTYCEADVGHKLGSECLKGLRRWLAGLGLDERPTQV